MVDLVEVCMDLLSRNSQWSVGSQIRIWAGGQIWASVIPVEVREVDEVMRGRHIF